jgi:hypothetical protein
MKTKNTEGSANPKIQHASGKDDVAKSPAMHSAGETTSACTPLVSGAAIHPEIIARASEPGALPPASFENATASGEVSFGPPGKADFLLGHCCNFDTFKQWSANDLASLEVDVDLSRFLAAGRHPATGSPPYGCITEHKGNGALFTLTYEERLFLLLGVATDEESSRSVWAWLSNQYQVLRTASYRMKISPKPSDLKLRRSRTLGSTYDCCDVPNKPGNWPWFSYLINDDNYFDLMCYFPMETGAMLAPLANQWCKRVQQKGLRKLLASRAKKAVSQEI